MHVHTWLTSGNQGDTGMTRKLWPEQIWLTPCDISLQCSVGPWDTKLILDSRVCSCVYFSDSTLLIHYKVSYCSTSIFFEWYIVLWKTHRIKWNNVWNVTQCGTLRQCDHVSHAYHSSPSLLLVNESSNSWGSLLGPASTFGICEVLGTSGHCCMYQGRWAQRDGDKERCNAQRHQDAFFVLIHHAMLSCCHSTSSRSCISDPIILI